MIFPAQIAIIGTAGRGDDAPKLNRESYHKMVEATLATIEGLVNREPWGAVSGGAAWANHIAVTLFMLGATDSLQLHLPCELTRWGYLDTGERGPNAWKTNPGATLNGYHKAFARVSGREPFGDLHRAMAMPGCDVTVTPGFFQRNTQVAQSCTHCIALTFGEGARLKLGGTRDTMSKFLARADAGLSAHIDLHTMACYMPAQIS